VDDKIRTPQSYEKAIAELNESDLDVVEGVKFQSIFNRLKSFHVCQPGLPPCVAHDLFEGVVAFDAPLFLRYFVKRKIFTVEILNKRLECLKLYGSDCKVRPSPLYKKLDRLTGSASQNWCFLRVVPLLIYDLVDTSNAVYQALLLLRVVVELVMAPAISVGQVAYMKVIIEDYLEKRQKLFPEVKLRPKHHYMSHYASQTMSFGLLVRLWTLRFESKHQYFKRCIRNSRNFINVTGMLANRHQMLQAYLSAGPRFASSDITVGCLVSIDTAVEHRVRECLNSLKLPNHGLYGSTSCCISHWPK